MPRQTSIQLTTATERQIETLKTAGFGNFTDIVRIAIDRMYQQEGKMYRGTVKVENDNRREFGYGKYVNAFIVSEYSGEMVDSETLPLDADQADIDAAMQRMQARADRAAAERNAL